MKPSKENIKAEPSRSQSIIDLTRKNTKMLSQTSKNKTLQMQNSKRPASSPKCMEEPSRKKRPAIGDITNAIQQCSFQAKKKPTKKAPVKEASNVKAVNRKNKLKAKTSTVIKNDMGRENKAFTLKAPAQPLPVKEEMKEISSELDTLVDTDVSQIIMDGLEISSSSSSAVMSSQESSKASENLSTEEDRVEHPNSGDEHQKPKDVKDVDLDVDPCNVCEYAESVFHNMKASEADFKIRKYLGTGSTITPQMRAILIDWLVEIQENFELYHETLYLAVKIVDLYLQDAVCQKDNLQLVGATALFISCKVEERYAPPLDDFIYICDDIYSGEKFLQMEKNILIGIGFKLHIPSSYRFLRRFGRVAGVSMKVLTLARFILESSLTEYEFVDCSPSMIAAASLNLALKMFDAGSWDSTLTYYSGYSEDTFLPIMKRLNDMIRARPKTNVTNVRKKYSHPVFYEVAKTEPLADL